jgi:NitT/TauT family transport system substrate-binding protein
MRRRGFIGLAGAAALAACQPAAPKGAKTKLTFALDWRPEAEHGGYYQALATGEYDKVGLDVQIIPGGPGVNVPQLLASGQVDLGIGSNSFIVMNLVKEAVPVTAVAAFFQKDPQVLIIHPDAAVKSIADLKGRPFLLADASRDSFWVWLKAKYGFTDDQVRKYNYNLGPFLADERAVQQGYVTAEPYAIEKEAHFKPQVFLLADDGYPSYASLILAPDKLLRIRSDVARKFIQASAAGWLSYLDEDGDAGDQLILKGNPEMNRDLLDQARAKMIKNGIVEGGDAETLGLGAMTDARWTAFFQAGLKQGLYAKDLPYTRAYTIGLVNKGAVT